MPSDKQPLSKLQITEIIGGLALSAMALTISGYSLYQSLQANRTSLAANQLSKESVKINEEALILAKKSEALRAQLTLKATISLDFPPILTLVPVSGEFVISGTELWFGGFIGREAVSPGVHDISEIAQEIDRQLSEHKPRRGVNFIDPGWGYYPIILQVDYLYQGLPHSTRLLYEVYYDSFTYNDGKKHHKGYTPIRKPRLVRALGEDEEKDELLTTRLEEWQNEHFSD